MTGPTPAEVEAAVRVLDTLPRAPDPGEGHIDPVSVAIATLEAGPGLAEAARARLQAAVGPAWTVDHKGRAGSLRVRPWLSVRGHDVELDIGSPVWWPSPSDLAEFARSLSKYDRPTPRGGAGPVSVTWDDNGFGGNCPVQATGRGTLPDGREAYVYFRARGNRWSVSVWYVAPGDSVESWPFGLPPGPEDLFYAERWGAYPLAAGWMPWVLAEQLATVAFALVAWAAP